MPRPPGTGYRPSEQALHGMPVPYRSGMGAKDRAGNSIVVDAVLADPDVTARRKRRIEMHPAMDALSWSGLGAPTWYRVGDQVVRIRTIHRRSPRQLSVDFCLSEAGLGRFGSFRLELHAGPLATLRITRHVRNIGWNGRFVTSGEA